MTTEAPCPCSSRAMARPRPREAPVTTATLPSNPHTTAHPFRNTLDDARRLIIAEHLAQDAAHLAHGGLGLHRLQDGRQQVLVAASGVPQTGQGGSHRIVVPLGL